MSALSRIGNQRWGR